MAWAALSPSPPACCHSGQAQTPWHEAQAGLAQEGHEGHKSSRCSPSCRGSRTTGWKQWPGWKHSLLGHMISTKNSQGFPMAFWKDWRLPVSSGGTAASSRTGGPPGGPPTTEYAFVRGCSGGSPGAAAEAWLRGLLPRLSWPAGRSRQPPLPTPLGTVWSDSLPLPPAPADRLSFSCPRARRLLPPALRVDPLLLLPGVKKGGEEWGGQCRALPLPRWPATARTTRGRAWWS